MEDNLQPPIYQIPTPPHKSPTHWAVVVIAIIAVIGYFMASYVFSLWPFQGLTEPAIRSVNSPDGLPGWVCRGDSCYYGPNSHSKYIFNTYVWCKEDVCSYCGDSPCLSAPMTEVDAFADWKTYTNTQYGFEFKYPESYGTNFEEIVGGNTEMGSGIERMFSVSSDKLGVIVDTKPFDIFCSNPVKFLNYDECVYQNSESGIRFGEFVEGGGIGYQVNMGGNNNFYFKFYCTDLDGTSCNQILSTFRFIPSTGSGQVISDTSTWKTYTNNSCGFEIKYPSYYQGADPLSGLKTSSGREYFNIKTFSQSLNGFVIEDPTGGESYTYDAKTSNWTPHREYGPKPGMTSGGIRYYYYMIGDLGARESALFENSDKSCVIEINLSSGACFDNECLYVGSEDDFDQIVSTFKFLEN